MIIRPKRNRAFAPTLAEQTTKESREGGLGRVGSLLTFGRGGKRKGTSKF